MSSLCILCAHHRLDDARVFHREARTLREVFSQITLICPHDSPRDEIDGIEIIGIPKPTSYWNRVGLLRNLHRAAKQVHADVYLCHELDSLMVGCMIHARRPRSRLVFDCHEYHPESFSEHVPSVVRSPARNALTAMEQVFVRQCDMVVTVNDILADKFRRYCRDVHVIENYPPKDIWGRAPLSDEKRFDLVYGGHMNRARGAMFIADMLKSARDRGRRPTMLVVGRFLDSESEQAVQAMIDNYDLAPWHVTGLVPHHEVGGYLSQARIGLVCDAPDVWRHAQGGVPVKMFEYMSANLPVVANDFPLVRSVINGSGVGRCVDVWDSEAYASAVLEMLDRPELLAEMGRSGRQAVEKHYCWETLQPRLLGAYESLLRGGN